MYIVYVKSYVDREMNMECRLSKLVLLRLLVARLNFFLICININKITLYKIGE